MNQTQKIEELEATIAKAQQQIEELKNPKIKRFTPEHLGHYYAVRWDSKAAHLSWGNDSFDQCTYDFFNCYETGELAEKAALLMRRSNAIIMAKLLVDPDFEPDWDDSQQDKWSVYYSNVNNKWTTSSHCRINNLVAPVSTKEKAEQMCELLTEWGVK